MNLAEKLTAHMRALGYEVSSPDTQEITKKLLCYLDLIEKWNRVHNLTSIRKSEDMLTHHIIDSLAVLPLVCGRRLADVGSGAGLPGIPIAVANPNWLVTLIESNQKKTAFLRQVKLELCLNNVHIVSGRVEDYQPEHQFDTVICRALCNLRDFVALAGYLLDKSNKKSRLVAMKGVSSDEELSHLPANYVIEKVAPVIVPGLDAKRHLIIINTVDESKF